MLSVDNGEKVLSVEENGIAVLILETGCSEMLELDVNEPVELKVEDGGISDPGIEVG